MKGRFLVQDWMTSTHQQAVVIHHIDHENTELRPDSVGNLVAIIPANCGAVLSGKTLALLSEADAFAWMWERGLHHKYGPRKQCKGCVP